MDKQNYNDQNGQSLRANGSIAEGDSEKLKKYLKILALFVVFFACFSIPFYCCYLTQENAKVAVVKMNAGQIRNWAQIYHLNNKSYLGLQDDYEIGRVLSGVREMNGEATIFADNDSYCAVLSFKRASFCVDNMGFVGEDDGACSQQSIKCN